ncbi:MAG: SusC/RagA family TonB-linked outer membrane protein [Bacteroidales bacterium]|nr:SusC/RagA family TonB-linked outer membrane protein [Bacteroidales bacterium]
MKKLLKSASLLFLVLFVNLGQLSAQESSIIIGQITDADTKEGLPGVNVVEINDQNRFLTGAITDFNGNFIIRVRSKENKIKFSYIGYESALFNINERTTFNIKMKPSSTFFEEVTVSATKMSNDGVVAYRDLATSVARLELDGLESVATVSVEEMLQGRLAGVDISSISGDPGAGLNIRIRGTATLNASNSPLIVVNGIPYNTSIDEDFDFAGADVEKFGNLIDVAPEDIESIEVLKDAASTAIWGSKAANGVLLIKTKRGIKSEPIFEYTFKNIIGWEPEALPMLKGGQYASLVQQGVYNYLRNAFYTNADATDPDNMFNVFFYDPEWALYDYYSQETNWVEEIIQVANSKQHVFSVRGGGDKSRYNMSAGYSDEEGTTTNNGLTKLTLRSSLDYDLSTKLRFLTDVLYTRYDQHNTYDSEGGQVDGLRSVAYTRMPNMSIYEFDNQGNMLTDEYFTPQQTLQGTIQDIYNPVALANLGINEQLKNNARAAFTLKYQPVKTLTLQSTITLDMFDNRRHRFLPYEAIGGDYDNSLTNYASDEFTKKSSIYTFNKAIFTPNLGANHSLLVLGQIDSEKTISRYEGQATNKSASAEFENPTGDKNIVSLSQSYSEFRSVGLFAIGHYKYKDKYLVSAGAKYEGISRYSAKSRWGFFPAVSAAWRISEESFMSNATWMNDFRLRLSWGISGNGPGNNYLYWNTYASSTNYSYMGMQGVQPESPELTSLQWETLEQINPGISFYAFDNRLNIELDYYKKTTHDLYIKSLGIPSSSGFGSIAVNEGSMQNLGYETYIDYTILKKKEFTINLNFNLSHNENTVLSMPENFSFEYGDMLDNGDYKISIIPGRPLGGFFGYNFLGVYDSDADAVVRDEDGNPVYGLNTDEPLNMIMGNGSGYVFEAGDAKYEDVNHDGKIDELDLVFLGDLNPNIMGGFGGRIFFKGFTLNALFNFKLGQQVINQTRMNTEKMSDYSNQSSATLSFWRTEGDAQYTDIPRPLIGYNDGTGETFNYGYNWLGSSRFVENGDYLRLKSISLSYNFPDKLLSKAGIGLTDARFYITGYNLGTWTNYSGQDPDVGIPSNPSSLPRDNSKTPPSQRVILGLNVKF